MSRDTFNKQKGRNPLDQKKYFEKKIEFNRRAGRRKRNVQNGRINKSIELVLWKKRGKKGTGGVDGKCWTRSIVWNRSIYIEKYSGECVTTTGRAVRGRRKKESLFGATSYDLEWEPCPILRACRVRNAAPAHSSAPFPTFLFMLCHLLPFFFSFPARLSFLSLLFFHHLLDY